MENGTYRRYLGQIFRNVFYYILTMAKCGNIENAVIAIKQAMQLSLVN